jgi:hypothetical protein
MHTFLAMLEEGDTSSRTGGGEGGGEMSPGRMKMKGLDGK